MYSIESKVLPWLSWGVLGFLSSARFRAFAMGSPLGARVCVPAHALDWIVGLPEPLAPSSFMIRSPWWVELAYLCTYSTLTKVLNWPVLGFSSFAMGCPYLCMYLIGTKVFTWCCLAMFLHDGVLFLDHVSIPMYVLDWYEGFHLVLSAFVFLHNGVTLTGSSVDTYICTRSKRRFSLGFVWHCVSSQWGHSFRVECPYLCMYSIGSNVLTWVVLGFKFFRNGFTL